MRLLIAILVLGCTGCTSTRQTEHASGDFEKTLTAISDAYWADKHSEVIDLCQVATGKYPTAIEPHFYMGASHTVFMELAEAKAQFREVLRLDPGNTNAIRWLDIIEGYEERGFP